MTTDFRLGGGTVAGREHRRIVPKNRQDDYCTLQVPGLSVAIVADGCGSGGVAGMAQKTVHSTGSSEVGASIGVRLMSSLIYRYFLLGCRRFDDDMLRRIRLDALAQLHVVASAMGPSLSEVVDRYFLFTLVGAILTGDEATFFALGDGVVFVNGEAHELQPEADNQPIYMGYGLTGSSLTDTDPAKLEFRTVDRLPTDQLNHFLIGTDGVLDYIRCGSRNMPGLDIPVGKIDQFWEQEKYVINTAAIERQLNLAARDWPRRHDDGSRHIEGGLLPDDTTLVVGQRLSARPV